MRRIQKIIQVTMPTAMIDSVPPTISCALKESWSNTMVMTAKTATTTTIAAATPHHTYLISRRRSDLTR